MPLLPHRFSGDTSTMIAGRDIITTMCRTVSNICMCDFGAYPVIKADNYLTPFFNM